MPQVFVVQAQRHWFCIFQRNLDHGRVRWNEQLGQDGNAETGFDQYACGFEGFAEVKIGHGVSGCEHCLKAADLPRRFFRVDQNQALVLEVGDIYRGTLCQRAVRRADTDDRDFCKFPVGPVRAAGVGKAEDDIHIFIFQQTVQVLERDGEKPELFRYVKERGIVPIGYCPIGSPSRPERDRTAEDVADTQMPEIVEIAKEHGVHPAIICIKWAVQNGQIPIPFSVKPQQYLENLRCAVQDPLTEEEMERIRRADKNCRLVKGQVFLWPGADGWEDLWDMDGKITQ